MTQEKLLKKYSYVRFIRLNGDEYWQVRIHRTFVEIVCRYWNHKVSKWASDDNYGDDRIIQFESRASAKRWVDDDISNIMEKEGCKVIKIDKFKALPDNNSLLQELIDMTK